MFSPAPKKPGFTPRKDSNLGHNSPVTPIDQNRASIHGSSVVPNRPYTGTPAPWTSRLSVLARIPQTKKNEKEEEVDLIKPVYVGDFPHVVRDEQARFLHNHASGDTCISGGMDRETSLSWIICGDKLFIWSYLSPAAPKQCVTLHIPPNVLLNGDGSSDKWLVSIINWNSSPRSLGIAAKQCNSAGIVLCNQKTQAVVYWPDLYSDEGNTPFTSLSSSDGSEVFSSPSDAKTIQSKKRKQSRAGRNMTGHTTLNSLIASAIPYCSYTCIALACISNGELWQFHCSPTGILREKTYKDIPNLSSDVSDSGHVTASKGYPRSLVWRAPHVSLDESYRQFFLLTSNEIQCLCLKIGSSTNVSKLWSHEIIGTDGDLGIKKDLAAQKQIWPLDVQEDSHGKEITILVATLCMDRVSSSSYTQYSLLTMQFKSGVNISEFNKEIHDQVLETKAPIQIIISKARDEKEDFLFSMRLRLGGKPSGSAIILAGDGTATVSHYLRNSTRLYQFDLPYDAGKVVDASAFPSAEDGEAGAWVVLTEKAGVWAIPEKAVLLGGVEPPEQSLSRKGSLNDGSSREERRNLTFGGNIVPKRASSEAWDGGDRNRAAFNETARRMAQDEESEALLGQIFHEFLQSGQVDGALERLQNAGAFERGGETNIFARTSKSIVDTLAKHWTTTRGAEIVSMSVISSQLMDKQHKHEQFLQFLALSKCHEELCSRQSQSLQFIMEHGEKLVGMIQLRELQNKINQNRTAGVSSSYSGSESQTSGSLWDLIQLSGERARRNTILLMDRDNAEVFYSMVSDIAEIFSCIDRELEYLISPESSFMVHVLRAYELSNACVTLVRTAIHYRNEHHMWYPSSENLTPWYCQGVMRNGVWRISSFMLQLLNETTPIDMSAKSELYSHLEVLAEVLLEAYTGAIRAKVDRGEDHKSLLGEYQSRKDELLGSLYQQVKGLVEAKCQMLNEGKEGKEEEILRELSSSLLSIAKQYEGYQTLWNICCDLNDSTLLRNLMHSSMGAEWGFSYFVFTQMYEARQFSKLIRLGEEFQEELSAFIKQHKDLLWLHQVYLHQFSLASDTLHSIAVSQDDKAVSDTDEGFYPRVTLPEQTLAERKRFFNLSKIAAMAGRGTDYETKVRRIEADLKLLKLQEEIIQLSCDENEKQNKGRRLYSPEDMIKMCLKDENSELSLQAFEVFAWTDAPFRQCNKTLLEQCWKKAADQDDWGKLHQASVAEGWTDEDTLGALRETILFKASSRCYGPETDIYEGGFAEVLPLREEQMDISLKVSGSSVELILMQHKDFAEAGKLMLTAIMLGSVQTDFVAEDGPSPME